MKEIVKQLSQLFRSSFLILLVLAATVAAIYRLLMLQIVSTDDAPVKVDRVSVYSQVMQANRGEIVDCNGEAIVSNKIGYSLIVEKAFFPSDAAEGNAILLNITQLLADSGYDWNDTLPISKELPYTFEAEDEQAISKLKKMLNLNDYATAENCIDKLISDYDIADTYTQPEQRTIAGLRYEMLARGFSMSNVFYLANDIDINMVMRIKELRLELRGVNVVEEAIRTIERGDVLPHEIGYIGPIYTQEEFETLSSADDSYALSDWVGKTGLERTFESELRGENGVKEITVTNGEVSGVTVTQEPVGGHTLQLTVNSGFQTDLQALLSDFCRYLRTHEDECRDANCGAIVVLDTDSNAVLGMATAPTYDLNILLDDYSAVANTENTPLVNRATDGLYRPGSTFKTITATAGLDTGIINSSSRYFCNREFHYIDSTYRCTGNHKYIGVTRAITVSCNIFFYELGLKLGIDRLVEYEKLFGLGASLGLESGDSAGYLACPETFERLGIDWYVGEIVQAAIGQSEIQVTPLQMAVVASTLANDGVRYRPHLVDAVWNNAMTQTLSESEPESVQTIAQDNTGIFQMIEDGMIGAAQTRMPTEYDLNRLGFDVAIKTGTPQSPRGTDSFVIGYAPADDPEIAFCAMIEGGKNAKYMVRQILELYAEYYPDSTIGMALAE